MSSIHEIVQQISLPGDEIKVEMCKDVGASGLIDVLQDFGDSHKRGARVDFAEGDLRFNYTVGFGGNGIDWYEESLVVVRISAVGSGYYLRAYGDSQTVGIRFNGELNSRQKQDFLHGLNRAFDDPWIGFWSDGMEPTVLQKGHINID